MEFKPYKDNEYLENSYYKIPQELFVSSLYKDKLNSDSKILYAFLLDRLSLSQKNHWIDAERNIYLIFTREEVQEKLDLSDKTVTKAFKQLNDVGLVQERRQGLGKPNLIYVGKIQHEETENLRFLTRKSYDSENEDITNLESENLRGINTNNIKTNIINTDSINPNSDDELHLKEIKDKCKLDEFPQEEKTILEDVIDNLYYKDNLKVGSVTVNHYKILSKLKLIVKENLIQLLDILKNIPNIQNAKNYLMICLYNNLGNTHITIPKKKENTTLYNGRDYENGSLDFLYANFAYDNEAVNYYFKKNESSYTKEFDKLKKKYNLQGQIRSNSIIMCEMIFTSDKEFFDTIGMEETKRYFEESYKFICNYKNLGEKNIISAVVHFDETTPHMHLIYIPVIHKKDKDGHEIDKVCCRDFWKGRDSYRNLQNAFHEYITSKGFNLQRGLAAEETKRKNETIQNYKQITNFENTKKVLENITLELPKTPNIKEFKRAIFNRDEKIENAIIKPRDELIQKLYQENKTLHKELSKQVNTVDFAENFKEDYIKMVEKSTNLKLSNGLLQKELENKEKELELKYKSKAYNMEHEYKKEINKLKQENKHLNKMIDKFRVTLKRFIKWLSHKFSYPSEDELVRDFEKETYTNFNFEKQLDINQFKKKDDDFDIEY